MYNALVIVFVAFWIFVVKSVLIFLIKGYQALTSSRRPCCRFFPSCSAYAIESIQKYGSVRGGWLAVKRIFRCRPTLFRKCSHFGYDPVP